MDDLDHQLISELRHNARASLSDLALALGVTRATIRARIERLQTSGEVLGYSVVLKADVTLDPVRALMMILIEGRGTERVIRRLKSLPEVRAIHATNGRWDLIVEIGTTTLETLDHVLKRIREFDGVSNSETNLLLSTSKSQTLWS